MTEQLHDDVDDLFDGIDAELDDQTKVTESYEYTPPPEGAAVARFIEYIELGLQPNKPYKGKDRPPSHQVRLTFELLGERNMREVEFDNVKRMVADKISITLPIKSSSKSSFIKLFNKMKLAAPDVTHMAKLLGQAYVVRVYHNTWKDASGTERVSAGFKNPESGEYSIELPRQENPVTGAVTVFDVPLPISPRRVFVFDKPRLKHWDSLFIDGSRTVKNEKGEEETVSNNWLQEKIMSALNYPGSDLELLVNSRTNTAAAEPPASEPKQEATKATKPTGKVTTVSEADDALNALFKV